MTGSLDLEFHYFSLYQDEPEDGDELPVLPPIAYVCPETLGSVVFSV